MFLKAFMLCYDVSNKTLVYSVGGEAMKVHSWGLPVLYFVTTMAFTSCKKTKKNYLDMKLISTIQHTGYSNVM